MSKRLASFAWAILTASLLLPLAFCTCGCAPAGAAAYALIGDVSNEPEYKLARVPTLVLVENYVNPDASEDDADVLSRYVIANLKKNLNNKKKEEKKKEIPITFIDPIKVYDLRTADSEKFHHMKIQTIGQLVEARQVIYISMDALGVQSTGGTEMMRGTGSARVKVVSTATGQTLWPQESSAGYPVGFESKLITPQQDISYDQARDSTMRTMAVSIARLFYKWNPSDDDDTKTFPTDTE